MTYERKFRCRGDRDTVMSIVSDIGSPLVTEGECEFQQYFDPGQIKIVATSAVPIYQSWWRRLLRRPSHWEVTYKYETTDGDPKRGFENMAHFARTVIGESRNNGLAEAEENS